MGKNSLELLVQECKKTGSLSLLTFECLCNEPLEVVHVFWVFRLGIAEDIPVLNVITRSATAQKTQEPQKATDKSAQDLNLPTALHHKDGRLVVLGIDPVEQHPQVQILLLPELQAVINQVEAQRRSVREGEEVRCSPHLLPLLPGEGGQP